MDLREAIEKALEALRACVCDRDLHRRAAKHAIGYVTDRAPLDREVAVLSLYLGKQLRCFFESVEVEELVPRHESDPSVFPLDGFAIEWLGGCIVGNPELAESVRKKAEDRWRDQSEILRLWDDPTNPSGPLRFADVLAQALWEGEIGAEIESSTPAIVVPTLERTVAAYFAKGRAVEELDGGTFVTRSGRSVATVDLHQAPALAASLRRGEGLDETETLAAHRLFRWLVHKGYDQKLILKLPDFSRVDVPRGLSGLATELGMGSNKTRSQLRKILTWMQHATVSSGPTAYHGLLTWTENRGTISIRIGDMLLPGHEQTGAKGSQARKLIPLPLRLPPLVGRSNEHGAQATLQLLALRDLRMGAENLAEARGVRIERCRWETLADEAGLRRSLLEAVLEAWQSGTEDSPAFLTSPAADLWDLAEAYGAERAVIVEGGRRQATGRKSAKRAAAIRQGRAA